MTLDIMESDVPIIVGSDTVGTLTLKTKIDNILTSEMNLTVYDSARIVLTRDRDPQV